MSNSELDDLVEEKLKQQLLASVERVEKDTEDELYRRLMEVLQQAATNKVSVAEPSSRPAFGWIPGGVGAAAAVAMVAWVAWIVQPDSSQLDSGPTEIVSQESIEVVDPNNQSELAEALEEVPVWDESFEMLDEMEFYAWLAEEEYAG